MGHALPNSRSKTISLRRLAPRLSPTGLLVGAALAALVWVNLAGVDSYRAVWEFRRAWLPGAPKSWIDDGLMALFFLLIGVEIERELTTGALNSRARALLPAAAAVGGMAAPALVYLAFNRSGETRAGWGVPVATDIAFVLGIFGALGGHAPARGRVFLTALAIVDDVGAILVIALFYSSGVSGFYLAASALMVVAMAAINRIGHFGPAPILAAGAVLWFFVLKSGIHPTIGGLATGLLLPQGEDDERWHRIERFVDPLVSCLVVPLFALANAGVAIHGAASVLTDRVALGVFFGLVAGKPVGIVGATWLARRALHGKEQPARPSKGFFALSLLGGVGFTMSLFIAELAFADSPHADAAKIGILAASAVAAASGFVTLRRRFSSPS